MDEKSRRLVLDFVFSSFSGFCSSAPFGSPVDPSSLNEKWRSVSMRSDHILFRFFLNKKVPFCSIGSNLPSKEMRCDEITSGRDEKKRIKKDAPEIRSAKKKGKKRTKTRAPRPLRNGKNEKAKERKLNKKTRRGRRHKRLAELSRTGVDEWRFIGRGFSCAKSVPFFLNLFFAVWVRAREEHHRAGRSPPLES